MKRLIRPKNSIRISAFAIAQIAEIGEMPQHNLRKTRYYLMACNKETVSLTLNGKQEVLQKNEAIIISPNTVWALNSSNDNLYPVVVFDGLLKNTDICNRVLNFSSLSGSLYKELILKLNTKSAFKDKEILLLTSLFEYFLNSVAVSLINDKSKSNDYSIFTEAVHYIKENLDKDVSINFLASHLCVSSSKLKRVFSKYSALSLHKFMLVVKTEKAKELLKSGFSSKEVSRRLGFENQNYFSAVFKRETGKSPSDFCKSANE